MREGLNSLHVYIKVIKMKEFLVIDGSSGEGGGQILRTSLSLSAITKKPFKIENIRAKRKKPGLLRQHLTCVKAMGQICDANVEGAEIGSQSFSFIPGEIRSGDYHFSIGTAGSTMLVAQTILPALIFKDKRSLIYIEGGTHNLQAPTFDFIENSYLPLIRKIGADVNAEIHKHGFYPSGGGKVSFDIKPCNILAPLILNERGELKKYKAEIILANIPFAVGKREIETIEKKLGWNVENLLVKQINDAMSPGNIITSVIEYQNIKETLVEFGIYGVRAEEIAEKICTRIDEYLNHSFVAGEYIADQIILPLALAKGGSFTTGKPSLHTLTNINVIQKFLPCKIMVNEVSGGVWKIEIKN